MTDLGAAGRPLSGIRVLDASIYLAGPYASLMLADLGAEVVKVEAPHGETRCAASATATRG